LRDRLIGIYIKLVAVCFLLLAGFFVWDVWQNGLASAASAESLLWYVQKVPLVFGLCAIIMIGAWLEEIRDRK
jgi:uncharacterized membrane protein